MSPLHQAIYQPNYNNYADDITSKVYSQIKFDGRQDLEASTHTQESFSCYNKRKINFKQCKKNICTQPTVQQPCGGRGRLIN